MDDVGWDLGRQIDTFLRGKEDWVAEIPRGQICAVLEVNELRLREDIGEHLYTVLEAKGG